MELSKAELKLFKEPFSASFSALNCESCFPRSFCMSFFPLLIESLGFIVKFTKRIKGIKIGKKKTYLAIASSPYWLCDQLICANALINLHSSEDASE